MCGIVGLFLKNPALRGELGVHFATMLEAMSERGPDSAGMAIYHNRVPDSRCKLTLYHPDSTYDWSELAADVAAALEVAADIEIRADHAVLAVDGDETMARAWLRVHRVDVRVTGYGRAMEVYKDMGRPADVVIKYAVAEMEGSHALGHTRMATESAVTTEHSHPFTAAADMCLVHNGSLSNHNRLRQRLRRRGMEFDTDNDTEVAVRYFAYRLSRGASLAEAMDAGLRDLDGFFTFTMATYDGFAVLRDRFACKPAVLAETEDWVAMASEFRGLADLPGIETAEIWEPQPAVVYAWTLQPTA